jgi:hypothetical protein
MQQIHLNLHPNALAWLRSESARIGIPVSEILRRLVDAARGER